MKKFDLNAFIEGAILVALGVLVAINGWAAMDIYFAIVFIVVASFLLIAASLSLIKTKILPFTFLSVGGVLMSLGIAILIDQLTLAVLISIMLFALIGFGGALAIYGIYIIVKRDLLYGIGHIVVGAGLIALSVVYINVPDFHKVFWIVVGVLIAVYGGLTILYSFLKKEN